ncbi:MFS transporter [Epidermidibacterium keratini]|uniref:MFS transporter n=1 Tax=Epidermidibacterium keratini TaxID=1891644 RepID=A0A7L4YNP3_9ACTN|nr:MFS transporter [Epidermidibacterium keratini]QHC00167.1 MFS transporter [Epidermidibacterium keratini]
MLTIEDAAHPTTATRPIRPAVVVGILALTGLTVSIMQTLVVPLLPHLPQILNAPPDDATWVLTITLMLGAVCTPITGRLGDMYGKKRMMLISLAMMVVGSVICALSSSLLPMLVGRGFQGAALGSIALGISLMRDILPADRLGKAIALMSATLGIGGAIGLPVSAVVAEHASWHWLFVGSATFGAVAIVAIAVLIPESPIHTGGHFDVRGSLLLSGALVSLLFALTKANSWGWVNPQILAIFGVSALCAVSFVAVERRTKQPLVDIEVSRRRPVLFTNLASVLVGFGMYTVNLVVTQLLQAPRAVGGFEQSMVVAGLCSAPMGFMMMVGSPLAARIIAQHGPRFSLRLGTLVIATGFTVGVFMVQQVWEAMIVALLTGAGIALSYAAMPTLIMRSVPTTQTAVANSVNTLSRSVGSSLASAIHGSILAATLAGVTQSFGPLNAFQFSFVLAIVACLLAFVLVSLIPASTAGPARVSDAQALANIEGVDDESQRPQPRRAGLQRLVRRPGLVVRRTLRTARRRPATRRPRHRATR